MTDNPLENMSSNARDIARYMLKTLQFELHEKGDRNAISIANDFDDALAVLITSLIEIRYSVAEDIDPFSLSESLHMELLNLSRGDLKHLIASRVSRMRYQNAKDSC